jgi:hypothetical protein
MGVLFLNGEPQHAVIAGDPLQLPPRSSSKTSELLFGTATITTLLRRHTHFFNDKDS